MWYETLTSQVGHGGQGWDLAPQPMKLMTTRWSTVWANRKSANALSGEMDRKSPLFWGFIWIRRQTVGEGWVWSRDSNQSLWLLLLASGLGQLHNCSVYTYFPRLSWAWLVYWNLWNILKKCNPFCSTWLAQFHQARSIEHRKVDPCQTQTVHHEPKVKNLASRCTPAIKYHTKWWSYAHEMPCICNFSGT